MEDRFLTKYEEECLREYYFDEENEVDDTLTEQGFIDWKENLAWIRIDEIVGSPNDQE